jgi:hypothetical protein
MHDEVDLDSVLRNALPNSTTTVNVSGELTLDTLCDYFTQFVRGCGYVLPENSKIGVTHQDF